MNRRQPVPASVAICRAAVHAIESHPATPLRKPDAQVARLRDVDSTRPALVASRTRVSMCKRTALFAQIGKIRLDSKPSVVVSGGAPAGAPAHGGSQLGLDACVRHSS